MLHESAAFLFSAPGAWTQNIPFGSCHPIVPSWKQRDAPVVGWVQRGVVSGSLVPPGDLWEGCGSCIHSPEAPAVPKPKDLQVGQVLFPPHLVHCHLLHTQVPAR